MVRDSDQLELDDTTATILNFAFITAINDRNQIDTSASDTPLLKILLGADLNDTLSEDNLSQEEAALRLCEAMRTDVVSDIAPTDTSGSLETLPPYLKFLTGLWPYYDEAVEHKATELEDHLDPHSLQTILSRTAVTVAKAVAYTSQPPHATRPMSDLTAHELLVTNRLLRRVVEAHTASEPPHPAHRYLYLYLSGDNEPSLHAAARSSQPTMLLDTGIYRLLELTGSK